MTTEVERTYVENKDQAQALANFLWNEVRRHLEDIQHAEKDLKLLYIHWGVDPVRKRIYMEVTDGETTP